MSLREGHPPASTRFSAVLCTSLLVLAAAPANAEAVLDVSGSVVSVAPRLEVRVVVTNRGDEPAVPLEISGELLGERAEARLASGVPPGGAGAALLSFSPVSPRPGTHALTLLLEHPVVGVPDGAGNPPVASRRAWLLVALGASPPPPVRLSADPLRLDVRGEITVRLESADGEPHRIRLRALPARGLRAEGDGADVDVPAHGAARAALPLVRAGAARGTRHAVLLVAEAADGPLARTTVLATPVEVAPFPSRLPPLRVPLLVLGVLLVVVALGVEAWRRRT